MNRFKKTRIVIPISLTALIFLLTLKEHEQLLKIIPDGQCVVAVWPYHPLFKRDCTFLTFDDISSHALGLTPGDPMRREFDPELFSAAIEDRLAAYIALTGMEVNYPPGWQQVAVDFLKRHESEYLPYSRGYLRRDLLPVSESVQSGNSFRQR